MKLIIGLILLAITCVNALAREWKDLPEPQKTAEFAKMFHPAPLSTVEVDPFELQNFRGKRDWQDLRGFIQVTPPKSECLTIQRNPEDPDVQVCKKSTLVFRLRDMDHYGRIVWRVKRAGDVTPNDLTWHTPYRVAVGSPYLDDEIQKDPKLASLQPPTYHLILNCRAIPEFSDRRIILTLASGKEWIIRFPEHDELLPQPEAAANLFGSAAKSESKDAEKKEDHAEKKEDQAEKKEDHAEKKEPAKKDAAPIPSNWVDRETWSIPRRGAYQMNVSYFQPEGLVGGKMKGTCRYTFNGPKNDPKTGRVECREGSIFQEILVPVTCLSELKH